MIYSGKKVTLEMFDGNLNGTVTGKIKLRNPIELDSTKKGNLGTQLRNIVKKSNMLTDYCKGSKVVMVSLEVQGNTVTTIIDLR